MVVWFRMSRSWSHHVCVFLIAVGTGIAIAIVSMGVGHLIVQTLVPSMQHPLYAAGCKGCMQAL